MSGKKEIIKLFRENVKGKIPDVRGKNARHDGREGHWLESRFGVNANASNEPDIMGYELKNETVSKTTFGDWSPNTYVFTNPLYKDCFEGRLKKEKQNSFLRIFGRPNPDKGGRFSWSGSPCPKIGAYNFFGQILIVDENKDIVVKYSYSKDQRQDKSKIVPPTLQLEDLEIARWYGESTPPNSGARVKSLKRKLEDKFNRNGWFTCKKDSNGAYCKICFGQPLNYDLWIDLVRKGVVFFDSGMHEGNPRPYSEWRANNGFWNSLIIEEYE